MIPITMVYGTQKTTWCIYIYTHLYLMGFINQLTTGRHHLVGLSHLSLQRCQVSQRRKFPSGKAGDG